MSIERNTSASAIVRTDLLWETLNFHKAQTICDSEKIPLVVCTALDKCSTSTLNHHDCDYLLRLNLTSSKLQDCLPGFVPLYVGMPVVLKCKNISTDLHITNRSQGLVRDIHTAAICPAGFTYCTCVLVEFPNGKVELSGLLKGYFLIVPVQSKFSTRLITDDGMTIAIQVTHYQVPIQPAFAVTGQSAQGKTLPEVLANIHEGGFGAYIATSRACTWDGICVTEPVTLKQLNKPIPFSLLLEDRYDCML